MMVSGPRLGEGEVGGCRLRGGGDGWAGEKGRERAGMRNSFLREVLEINIDYIIVSIIVFVVTCAPYTLYTPYSLHVH